MVARSRFTTLALLLLVAASVALGAPSPAAAQAEGGALHAGDAAPNFDIATTPYGWRRFSDFCKEGEIVLVFEPDDKALIAIDREARQFAESGVTITVVRSDCDGANWDAITRLGLSCTLLSDPNGYIAEIYGVGKGGATPVAPAWCHVDRRGIVRHMVTGATSDLMAIEIGSCLRQGRSLADGTDPR